MGPVGDFLDTGSSSKSPYIGPLFDQSVAKSPWLLHSLLRNLSSNRCFCALLGGENRGFSIKGCLVMKNQGFCSVLPCFQGYLPCFQGFLLSYLQGCPGVLVNLIMKKYWLAVSTHFKNINRNQHGNLPQSRGENQKYLKPPPRVYIISQVS